MILTFRQDSHFLEDIIAELVVVHFESIDDTSLRSSSPLVFSSLLFHLKLFYKIADCLLVVTTEDIQHLRTSFDSRVVTTIVFDDCLVINDTIKCSFWLVCWDCDIEDFLARISIELISDIVVKSLVSYRFWSTLTTIMTGGSRRFRPL